MIIHGVKRAEGIDTRIKSRDSTATSKRTKAAGADRMEEDVRCNRVAS